MKIEEFLSFKPKEIFCEQYEEKKSKFLCFAKYCDTKIDCENFILDIKKQEPKAKHICYAWKVAENGQVFQKSNDDGEPSGTAGKPILNIIEKNELLNVCIVVARIFGGIKLGAGNLLRAYSNSAKSVVENKNLCKVKSQEFTTILVPYEYSAKSKKTLESFCTYENYLDNQLQICFDEKDYNKITKKLEANSIPFSKGEVSKQTKFEDLV